RVRARAAQQLTRLFGACRGVQDVQRVDLAVPARVGVLTCLGKQPLRGFGHQFHDVDPALPGACKATRTARAETCLTEHPGEELIERAGVVSARSEKRSHSFLLASGDASRAVRT